MPSVGPAARGEEPAGGGRGGGGWADPLPGLLPSPPNPPAGMRSGAGGSRGFPGGGSEIIGVRVSSAVKKPNEGADLLDGNIQGRKSKP